MGKYGVSYGKIWKIEIYMGTMGKYGVSYGKIWKIQSGKWSFLWEKLGISSANVEENEWGLRIICKTLQDQF